MQKYFEVETNSNLPEEIRSISNLRGNVIAWTKLDPQYNDKVFSYGCCQVFGFYLAVPCLLPLAIISCPFLVPLTIAVINSVKAQYWILTEYELTVVSKDHDACCIPGCWRTGNVVKNIPLENITDCGQDTKGRGCGNICFSDLPRIYVDTAKSRCTAEKEAQGIGLANYESFIREVLNQRDIVKGRGEGLAYGDPVVTAMTIDDRSSGRPAEERIKEIKSLYDNGILTREEYDQKRKDIIDSI